MNHTELLENLQDNTILNWEDDSDMHGWTVRAVLDEGLWVIAGFPENNQESDETNIIQVSIYNDSQCLFAIQFNISNNGILQMYGFLNGLKSGQIVWINQ